MKNIFSKMLFIFLIPALGMLYFSATFVHEKITALEHIKNEKTSIDYLLYSEQVLNELQKERGLSSGFLSSNAKQFKKELKLQREKTDKILKNYKQHIQKLKIKNIKLKEQIKKIQTKLFLIEKLRLDVDKHKIDVMLNIKEYTQINSFIIDSIAILLSSTFSQDRFNNINTLYNLIEIKDLAGIERALLTNVFSNPNEYNGKLRIYIKTIIDKQNKDIKNFLNKTSLENTALFYDVIDLNTANSVLIYRDMVLNYSSQIKEVDSSKWWNVATKRVDLFGNLLKKISSKTIIKSQKVRNKAKRALAFSVIIWIIGIAGFIFSIIFLKNLLAREKKNYENLKKQKQLYNLLSKTNEHIIHDIDMDEVFKNICEIAVNEVDLNSAFIAMLDGDKKIKIVSISGNKDLQNYLLRFNLGIKNDSNTRVGLAGRAILEARNIIVEDLKKDSASLLRDVAEQFGINSAGAYPLVQSNTIVGAMVFYSNDKQFFDKDITALFEKITEYLSFGLEKEVEKRLYKLYEEELRISSYAFDSQEAMMITDKEANIIKVNNAFTKITGYKKDEVLGLNPRILKSGYHENSFFDALWKSLNEEGRWSGEVYNRHKDGMVYPQKTAITAIKDKYNKTTHYIAQFYDISDIKQSEQKLRHQARHDALTGLPNRIVLKDRLDQAIKSARRHKHIGALMFIDLDNFKNINDTLGHDVGDELLKKVAKMLISCVREEDSVIRFGGDEFIILTSNLSLSENEAKEKARLVAQKIREKIDVPISINGYELFTTPSIGVSLFPSNSSDTSEIIKQADIAMYKAKEAGKNSIEFFTAKN